MTPSSRCAECGFELVAMKPATGWCVQCKAHKNPACKPVTTPEKPLPLSKTTQDVEQSRTNGPQTTPDEREVEEEVQTGPLLDDIRKWVNRAYVGKEQRESIEDRITALGKQRDKLAAIIAEAREEGE